MFCKCPTCPAITHIRLVAGMTEADWIAKHAPDTKPGEMPLAPCFTCWKKPSPVQQTPPAPSPTVAGCT